MTTHTFEAFPKIQRYSNEQYTITEKIDGTNAAIRVEDGAVVAVQSRKRIITPGKATDNAGFAGWVMKNEQQLVDLLGDGLHFGEWWGLGIQRSYGLQVRRFSLFNTHRWGHLRCDEHETIIDGVRVDAVPVLAEGPLDELDLAVQAVHYNLAERGSIAAPGFMEPEGVMIYLHRLGTYLKAPLDDAAKGGIRDIDGNVAA